MMTTQSVCSPLTGSPNVTKLDTIKTSQLIADWQRQFGINIVNEVKDNEEVYLYQCNQTKLKFFIPLTISGSSQLYEQLETFNWYYMPHKWEHDSAMLDLRNAHNVIEIGCGTGAFVKRLQDKLMIKSLGIEVNHHTVEKARNLGIPVFNLNLYDIVEERKNKFDAVCAFQVLEHIPEPKRFVSACVDIIQKGGILIFCVPNSESFLQDQYNLLDLPPHHMSRWSVETFRALENIFPLKLEKVLYEPLASYHVSGYLNTYYRKYRLSTMAGKFLWNRFTMSIYRKTLTLGLRKSLLGQSLYVKFRKLA